MATTSTMRVVSPAAAFVDTGVVVRTSSVARIGSSTAWGSTRALEAKTIAPLLHHERTTMAPRADMSDSTSGSSKPIMPNSHRIKAASVSAFQDFQNARANREYPGSRIDILDGYSRYRIAEAD